MDLLNLLRLLNLAISIVTVIPALLMVLQLIAERGLIDKLPEVEKLERRRKKDLSSVNTALKAMYISISILGFVSAMFFISLLLGDPSRTQANLFRTIENSSVAIATWAMLITRQRLLKEID